MPLKVMTLNLWNNSGPYAERTELVRDWIRRLDPDLIGFQEVLVGEHLDELRDLLHGSDYYSDFVRAVPFWDDARLDFGNAIASRWPIADRETIELPDAGDDEHRAALAVTIEAPFGPVSLTCTHLNWKLHHGYVRERQVVAVCEFARRRRPRDGFPPIVVGDFNATPDSTEIRYVTGLHALEGHSVHFHDAFRVAGRGNGTTWSNENPYAALGLEPDRRIDYIFVGAPRRDGLGQVLECRAVCNEPAGGVWPSDHFGVYAELRTEPISR